MRPFPSIPPRKGAPPPCRWFSPCCPTILSPQAFPGPKPSRPYHVPPKPPPSPTHFSFLGTVFPHNVFPPATTPKPTNPVSLPPPPFTSRYPNYPTPPSAKSPPVRFPAPSPQELPPPKNEFPAIPPRDFSSSPKKKTLMPTLAPPYYSKADDRPCSSDPFFFPGGNFTREGLVFFPFD